MIPHTDDFWIRNLQLSKHIEGGWYSEVYRSALAFGKDQLPAIFDSERNACTHIYFLLQKHGFSAFHRIKSDELWHFYAGDPLVIYEISTDGKMKEHFIGNDPEKGQALFCAIKGGHWFASKVMDGGEYGLAGCTVAPGFDFNDFEMAERKNLAESYPQYSELINQLTH